MITDDSGATSADRRSDALRESLTRLAADSGRLSDVHVDVAVLARQAYHEAVRRQAQAGQAVAGGDFALEDLKAARAMLAHAQPALSAEVRRGIWWDIAAGLVPALLLVLVVGGISSLFEVPITTPLVLSVAGAFAIVVGFILMLATGRLEGFAPARSVIARLGGMSSPVLSSSAGALVLGVVIFSLAGFQASDVSKDHQTAMVAKSAQDLARVDNAAAVTLAALKAHVEASAAKTAVQQQTGVGLIVDRWSPDGGVLEARAPMREGEARLTVRKGGEGAEPVLESFLVQDGKVKPLKRYLVGMVVPGGGDAGDGRTVRLQLDAPATTSKLYTLPEGKLTPRVGSQVVASEAKPGQLSYVQEVDGVVQRLREASATAGDAVKR